METHAMRCEGRCLGVKTVVWGFPSQMSNEMTLFVRLLINLLLGMNDKVISACFCSFLPFASLRCQACL